MGFRVKDQLSITHCKYLHSGKLTLQALQVQIQLTTISDDVHFDPLSR